MYAHAALLATQKLHRCFRSLLPLATQQATQISSAIQISHVPLPLEEHKLAAGDNESRQRDGVGGTGQPSPSVKRAPRSK